jgi:hypothetical protein
MATCPKCQGQMETGFMPDATYGGTLTASWVEGEPVKSFWAGLKLGGKRRIPARTDRCTKCGYLESYAKP